MAISTTDRFHWTSFKASTASFLNKSYKLKMSLLYHKFPQHCFVTESWNLKVFVAFLVDKILFGRVSYSNSSTVEWVILMRTQTSYPLLVDHLGPSSITVGSYWFVISLLYLLSIWFVASFHRLIIKHWWTLLQFFG